MYAFAGTATIEIDFVGAELLADFSGGDEFIGVIPGDLEGGGSLLVEVEEFVFRSMNDGIGDKHFGVKKRSRREESPESSGGGVREAHHRGGAEPSVEGELMGLRSHGRRILYCIL